MQISFTSQGSKAEVLADLAVAAKKDQDRFNKACAEHKVVIGTDLENKPIFKPIPIKNTTSTALVDNVLANVAEQLEHLADDAPVAVSFSLVVHRDDPTE